MEADSNWTVHCKNQACETQIELLRPNLLEKLGDRGWSPKPDFQMLFLCPECGFVYAYTAEDFHLDSFPSAAPYLSPTSSLTPIKFQCDENNCEVLATVNMHGESILFPNEAVLRMERGMLRVDCPSGHALKLPALDKIKVQTPATFPHSPAFQIPEKQKD